MPSRALLVCPGRVRFLCLFFWLDFLPPVRTSVFEQVNRRRPLPPCVREGFIQGQEQFVASFSHCLSLSREQSRYL